MENGNSYAELDLSLEAMASSVTELQLTAEEKTLVRQALWLYNECWGDFCTAEQKESVSKILSRLD